MSISFKSLAGPAPFRLGALRDDLIAHPAWQRAREECLATLGEGGRLTLCGPPGTGKTLLMEELRATLRAEGRSVVLLAFGEPETVLDEGTILLIDEADRFSNEQLRQLCLRPGPLVLAGLPKLRARAADAIGLIGHVALDPLTAGDVARVVAARLVATGRAPTDFSPEALNALARQSGGLFRLVVILAGAALFFADLRGAACVTAADVDEASAMREAIADEVEETETASVAVRPTVNLARWPRRIVIALFAVLAATGVIVHLSVTAGSPAVAADTTRDVAAISAAAAGGASVRLSPKRPLTPKRSLARRD